MRITRVVGQSTRLVPEKSGNVDLGFDSQAEAGVCEQLLAGASDTGANGPDRATHRRRRFFVGKPDHLSENEGGAPLIVEDREQFVDLEPGLIVMVGVNQIGDQPPI